MLAARTTVRPVTTANMAAAPGRGHQAFDLKSGHVLAVAVLAPRASIPAPGSDPSVPAFCTHSSFCRKFLLPDSAKTPIYIGAGFSRLDN